MTYPLLTTADKGALLDAQKYGKWIAKDASGTLYAYRNKPVKKLLMGEWYDMTWVALNWIYISFIHWEDAEPVNIDLALAQIAEMEGAEKPKQCEYCAKLSRYAGWGYAEWFEQTAVDDVYEISVDVKFCPNCGNPINSPYTEGATK